MPIRAEPEKLEVGRADATQQGVETGSCLLHLQALLAEEEAREAGEVIEDGLPKELHVRPLVVVWDVAVVAEPDRTPLQSGSSSAARRYARLGVEPPERPSERPARTASTR